MLSYSTSVLKPGIVLTYSLYVVLLMCALVDYGRTRDTCQSSLTKLVSSSQILSCNAHSPSGVTLSTVLVNAGYTTFDKLLEANPRELELVVNRHPPFGNQVYNHHYYVHSSKITV